MVGSSRHFFYFSSWLSLVDWSWKGYFRNLSHLMCSADSFYIKALTISPSLIWVGLELKLPDEKSVSIDCVYRLGYESEPARLGWDHQNWGLSLGCFTFGSDCFDLSWTGLSNWLFFGWSFRLTAKLSERGKLVGLDWGGHGWLSSWAKAVSQVEPGLFVDLNWATNPQTPQLT